MEPRRVRIALEDESKGYSISPSRVPLGVLKTFAEQVQAFLRGSEKEVDASAVAVGIEKGSLALHSEPLIAPSLFHDLAILGATDDLSDIDPKRRALIEDWQASAAGLPSRSISIAADHMQRIVINHASTFHLKNAETWVDVERYVQGELMDLGGVSTSNAHIKLPDGGKLLVRTDRDLIRAEKQNKVYQRVHVRIKAKYNVRTGELRDPVLMQFVDYAPSFDEAAFNRAVENGSKAWSDVDDPAAWVRGLRGTDE